MQVQYRCYDYGVATMYHVYNMCSYPSKQFHYVIVTIIVIMLLS